MHIFEPKSARELLSTVVGIVCGIGVIAAVTNVMHWQYRELNISGFRLSRSGRGQEAIMTIETDNLPPDQLIEDIKNLDNVTNAILIRKL